ncbi:MAG: recombinase family protein [Oscillospiraceae bacterium]|nr:recombinase family protein [Oscillospiraceae bacterium]
MSNSTQDVIYLRKSRKDDEASKTNADVLSTHERTLLDLANNLGLNVTDIRREVVSGDTIAARPEMQRLLTEIEAGLWRSVIVMEVERLARGDTIDQGIVAQTFKYSDTKIVTPMRTYDPANEFDEEYFEFGLFMSRREYKTINRRMQAGRLAGAKMGRFVRWKAPYGYDKVKIEGQKGFSLAINKEQSKIVKMIYNWSHDDKLGYQAIATNLNRMKVPSPSDKTWEVSSVRHILETPIYAGKIPWRMRPAKTQMIEGERKTTIPRQKYGDYEVFDGLHEAIIPFEVFETIQQRKQQNYIPKTKTGFELKSVLSGVVYCGLCGKAMRRRAKSSGSGSTGVKADTLACPSNACPNVSSYVHIVEEKLLEALSDLVKDYKLELKDNKANKTNKDESNLKKSALAQLRKEHETLIKQRETTYSLVEQGVYSTDEFLERNTRIAEELADVENSMKTLEEAIRTDISQKEYQSTFVPRLQGVLEQYHKSDSVEFKNKLLKEIIERVEYTKEKRGGKTGGKDEFTLEIRPLIPMSI